MQQAGRDAAYHRPQGQQMGPGWSYIFTAFLQEALATFWTEHGAARVACAASFNLRLISCKWEGFILGMDLIQ